MTPVPAASSPDALRRMQRQRRRDTCPELALRRELHRLGLRYRVERRVLPGLRRRVDVVLGTTKVAVFVDGCFWHGCPEHATLPRANAAWWADKLARNVERDRDTDHRLADAGWLPVHVWEHEDMVEAAVRIRDVVLVRRFSRSRGTQ
jgi:DNA mismatch endonuclease, patch repair protein